MNTLKNLHDYNSFIEAKNNQDSLNEGLFGFIGKMIGKIKASINKTKGGKEIQVIYDKYLKIINQELVKKAGVDLHIGADLQISGGTVKTESFLYEADTKEPVLSDEEKKAINTDQDTKNKNMSAKTLKEKAVVIQQIIDLNVAKALKEMDQVLVKMGGAEKNPKLATIINNEKDQFKLDVMNAKIQFLEKAGDKAEANKIATERDKLAKALDAKWNLETVDHVEVEVDGVKLKVGTPYRYKSEKGLSTIKISKKSDKPGKVLATYVSDKFGDIKEQEFTVANIEKKFKIKNNKKYGYYSKTNNDIIKVITQIAADIKGDEKDPVLIDVKAGEHTFKVDANALLGEVTAE